MKISNRKSARPTKLSILEIHNNIRPQKQKRPIDLSPFLVEFTSDSEKEENSENDENNDDDDYSASISNSSNQENTSQNRQKKLRKKRKPFRFSKHFRLPKFHSIEIQCDPIDKRPETPPIVQGKTGLDFGIQVDSNELFDFDQEIQPMLNVFVDKIIDQSLTEVRQEQCIHALSEHYTVLKKRQNDELERIKDLEDKERQLFTKRQEMIVKQLEWQEKQSQLKSRVFAIQLSNLFLHNIINDTLDNLQECNIFTDPVKTEIEQMIINQTLMNNVCDKILNKQLSYQCTDDIIQSVIKQIIKEQSESIKHVSKKWKNINNIHLYITVQDTNPNVKDTDENHMTTTTEIGPLTLKKWDPLRQIKILVRQWYIENKQDDLKGSTIELYLNTVKLKDTITIGNLHIFGGYLNIQSPKTKNDNQNATKDLFELKIRRKLIEKEENEEDGDEEQQD